MKNAEKPIRIAIVEDDPTERERLRKMLELYSVNNGMRFSESVFETGEAFLQSLDGEIGRAHV